MLVKQSVNQSNFDASLSECLICEHFASFLIRLNLPSSKLLCFKTHLSSHSSALPYTIPEAMQTAVEADFVARRKVDGAFRPEDLQRLLAMAQALCAR